jgi:hypothetical protein
MGWDEMSKKRRSETGREGVNVTVCAWMRGEGREMGLVVEKGSEMSRARDSI